MRMFHNIPIAGMRVIKTALAVFLCLSISHFTNSQQFVYASIVAIVCMQKDWENSMTAAGNRIVATLFGVAFGYFTYVSSGWLGILNMTTIRYAYIAVMLVLLVNTLLIIEKHNVTSVASIVFVSVASIQSEGHSAGQFALVRMIDTFVGIGVALLVNITITDSESIKRALDQILSKRPKDY